VRVSTDGGSSYDATAGNYEASYNEINGGTHTAGTSGVNTAFPVTGTVESSPNYPVVGTFLIWDLSNTSWYKQGRAEAQYQNSSAALANTIRCGVWKSNTAVDALRVLFNTGNITSGKIRLYGII
jgi:hypothetical protein